jgi:glycosyltransferase involved in cell wall biosynthesis
MRILQVIPYFPPAYAFGGPVKAAYQISRELAKRGHEVVVYTTDAKDFSSRLEETDFSNAVEGLKVYRFRNLSLTLVKKLKLFITPQLILSARKEVKEFDVIHLHEYRTFQNIVIHHYACKYNVPYVLQVHGSLPRIVVWQRLKWIYDFLFGYKLLRDAPKVIALSEVEAGQYKNMGVPEEKIAIIPNGIDLSEYAELPHEGVFKRKFNIPEDNKVILYLGRIHKIKGIDFLIRAYAHLKNEKKYKNIVLTIVGPDDGFLSEVKSLVRSLGISRSVVFIESLYGKEKLSAYVDSDIIVLPSRYETFPNVVLEAYACSKPVIASDVEAMQDIVLHGETGLLFQAGNVKELTNAIEYMLTHPEEAERMGRNARRLVEEKFSIDRIVTQLEKNYEKIIN